jgi:hypothetical protein
MSGLLKKALAGLGKGMADVGETTLRAQVEEMRQMRLAQYQAGIHTARDQQKREWENEDFEKKKDWEREKLGLQHDYAMRRKGAGGGGGAEEVEEEEIGPDGQPTGRTIVRQARGGGKAGKAPVGKWENFTDEEHKLWQKNEKTGEVRPIAVPGEPTPMKVPSEWAYDGADAEKIGKGLLNEGRARQLKAPPAGDKAAKPTVDVGGVPMTVGELNEQYKAYAENEGARMKPAKPFKDWLQETYGITLSGALGAAPQGGGKPAGASPSPGRQVGGRLKPSDVVDGFRFTGGNPNDPASWESVR